jgi:hypothetical protein
MREMNAPRIARRAAPIWIAVVLTGCGTPLPADVDGWRSLFNGRDLEGWDSYLGPAYSEGEGEFDGAPMGVNVDPDGVFTVVQEDGQSAIRIS